MSDPSSQTDAKGALTRDETAQLTDQLAGLARSGRPLSPGLAALGSELPGGRLKSSLVDLSAALEEGLSLDQAMAQQKDRIPPHLRGLVLGGLKTGQIGDILGRFSAYMGVGTELKRKLWLSLAYPIASIVVALTLFIFIHVALVGMFEAIFRDFGIPLPRLTVAMLLLSHGLRIGWPVLAILGAAILGGWLLSRIVMKAPQRRSLAKTIPVIGRVWRYISWAEFCHLLALLLESRLALPEALRVAGEGVQDADLERECLRMADEVEGGATLARAMMSRRELPAGLARLLHWAGDHNASADILHMAGEMFEARARAQATFAGTVMAVLSVVLVLWGVFTVVAGLMLPLVTLISKLSG
jgi:general secretion pathway protein F